MQSVYSVYGTRLHLVLDDEFAKTYNEAMDAFHQAQLNHMERTGSKWNGEELWVDWTDKHQNAFNDFAEFMNRLIELNGGTLDIGGDGDELDSSEHLIKVEN